MQVQRRERRETSSQEDNPRVRSSSMTLTRLSEQIENSLISNRAGMRAAERVNDFAAPFVMNLLRRLVVISVRQSAMVVGLSRLRKAAHGAVGDVP